MGRNVLLDGIKGGAIIAVVLFHLGIFPIGYLGVDVFFVIAGFLTAGSIQRQIDRGEFGYFKFISGKVKRLLPLVLCASVVALLIGWFVMLPDDLDHMARSIVATNLFCNNILCWYSNGDYWATKNEYAPMLHFWYLGVLMQFYVIYPLIVLLCRRLSKDKRILVAVVGILVILSATIWFSSSVLLRFYLTPFRFFEFGLGVLASYVGLRLPDIKFRVLLLPTIGRASLSVYVWHYIIISFVRYIFAPEINLLFIVLYLMGLTVISLISFRLFEVKDNTDNQYKRLKNTLFFITFTIVNSISIWLYLHAGVVRDIPELDIDANNTSRRMHLEYCDRIYRYDINFPENGKVNVLIIGNSWMRDWANVLLESSISNRINIAYSYTGVISNSQNWCEKADVIFRLAPYQGAEYHVHAYDIDRFIPIYYVGYKYFGPSNGFAYSRRFLQGYYSLTVKLPDEVVAICNDERKTIGSRYIDLMSAICIGDNRIPVFSDKGKMISHDCYHFTPGGAKFMANALKDRIEHCFAEVAKCK